MKTAIDDVSVDIYRGSEGLTALEPAWRALNARQVAPSFVSQFEWYRALMNHRVPQPDDVRFLAVKQASECLAIIPIQRVVDARRGFGWLNAVSLPADSHSSIYDFPASERFIELSPWQQVIQAVAATFPGSRALLIPASVEDSAADVALRSRASWVYAHPAGTSCYFDCTQTSGIIRSGYASRLNKSLKRGRSKAVKAGSLSVNTVTAAALLPEALADFLQLESSGWKGSGGTESAIALDTRRVDFYRALYGPECTTLSPYVRLLRIGNVSVAGQLGLKLGAQAYILKIAYSEAHAEYSPGQLLMDEAIADCCNDSSVKHLSLVTGTHWMADWSPGRKPVADRWLMIGQIAHAYSYGFRLAAYGIELARRLKALHKEPI